MRLAFLGTGSFAVPAFQALADAGHDVACAVTRPERPAGKHQRIEPGPVHKLACERRWPLMQPDDVNRQDACFELRGYSVDLLIVADFGQILSQTCLGVASMGGLNIHGSLLPRFRGAAPVAWAIYHGETETGVTIIQMSARLDAGGIIAQQRVPIHPEHTAGQVEAALAELGARMIVDSVSRVEARTTLPQKQDESLATRAPRLKKTDGLVVWARTGLQICNQIRAMQPWPVAYTHMLRQDGDPLRLQLLRAKPFHEALPDCRPGIVTRVDDAMIVVATGGESLALMEVKPAGSKSMSAPSFARGYAVRPGTRFE